MVYQIKGLTPNIIRVIDADGVIFPVPCRLHGIDAPEKGQPGYAPAVDYLETHIIPGRTIFRPEGIDFYNRLLVTIFHCKTNLNEEMVKRGLAWSICPEYSMLEAQAKREKKGIWGYKKPPIEPSVWRKLHPRKEYEPY